MRWLLDEMLPPASAAGLRERGHDAVSVVDLGLRGARDGEIFERAVQEARVVVTENCADYANLVATALNRQEPCVPVVFVRRDGLPKRGALAEHLAEHLRRWAVANPDPYLGLHWP